MNHKWKPPPTHPFHANSVKGSLHNSNLLVKTLMALEQAMSYRTEKGNSDCLRAVEHLLNAFKTQHSKRDGRRDTLASRLPASVGAGHLEAEPLPRRPTPDSIARIRPRDEQQPASRKKARPGQSCKEIDASFCCSFWQQWLTSFPHVCG